MNEATDFMKPETNPNKQDSRSIHAVLADWERRYEVALRREKKLRDEINMMRRELTWTANERARIGRQYEAAKSANARTERRGPATLDNPKPL